MSAAEDAAAVVLTERSLSLFDLAKQLVELMEFRETEDLKPEERDAVDNEILKYVQAEVAKVDNVRAYLRHCEIMAAGARDEARMQSHRAEVWERRHERILACVKAAMDAQGAKVLEGRTGKLIVKGNGGKRALVIDNEDAIPEAYRREQVLIETIIEKEEIRKAIERGEDVAGARLLPRGAHVEVK